MKEFEINEAIDNCEKYQDPLNLLGKNISFDDFVDWLEIALDEEDGGLESLQAVYDRLLKFGHDKYAKITKVYIKRIKDK